MAVSYRYFFILGNTPILSSAEIAAVFSRMGIVVQWFSTSAEVAIVETATVIDASALMVTLGGSIKIGRMLSDDRTIEQWVREKHCNGAHDHDHGHHCRIVVGVSVYKSAVGVSNAKCEEMLRTLRGEILNCKRILKEEGRALRLVTTRDRMLPSVALVTEHMLEHGGELVALLSNNGETQLGETLAVQAFQEYRKRDMGRPSRDALRGMLPQKVAQMMINLAGVKDGGIILDPFCGSGTVLSEAALLGYNVIGSDISEAAVADTKKNFQWLKNDSRLTVHDPRLFVSDVRFIADHLEKQSVDAIVTEPYLGPPLTGKESPALLGKVRRDVQALVTDAFKSFRDVLRPGGHVVIVLPVYQRSDLHREVGPHALLPIDDIQKLGWSLHAEGSPRMGGRSLTSRGTILYRRADQHLAREITVWTRV